MPAGNKPVGPGQAPQMNPGNAGPKGALAQKTRGGGKAPSSGAPGNEGHNTRRDFVRGPRGIGRNKSR